MEAVDNVVFDRESARKVVELKSVAKWFPLKYGVTDFLAKRPRRYLRAVDNVSFDVYKGENLGLVGESGCGKSTLARTILRIYEPTKGSVTLEGQDISHLKSTALRVVRPKMQMVFQDPYSSLNPRMSVYEMLEEMLKVHNVVPKHHVSDHIKKLLEMCGLTFDIADRFPGEFSGGQRQRISIARALSLNPRLIVADEPVSALDVSIQAQIINLLSDLQRDLNLTILFTSHDLRLVRFITHRVAVMYLGGIVELGVTDDVFEHPYHPYTDVLAKAVPALDPTNRERNYVIEGEPPSPIDMPLGCRFHPRCRWAKDICRAKEPELKEVKPGRQVTCHFPFL